MAKLVRDDALAGKLRAATVNGEAVVEADGDRFLVVRIPGSVELTDPEEIDMALDAAAEYIGPRYEAGHALAVLRREVADKRMRP